MSDDAPRHTKHPLEEIAEATGGTITEAGILPDNSGYGIISIPLKADHWLYQSAGNPPMAFRMGTADPRRENWERKIEQAGQYAVRCATMSGKEMDFDPDALVRNLIIGMLGYNTADGLSGMDDGMWNPNPIPPVYNPNHPMTDYWTDAKEQPLDPHPPKQE